jgi:hydrogenase maturation protease
MTAHTLVLGVGNSLMGDDGVGAAVVTVLVDAGLPPGVRAVAAPDVLALPQIWNNERFAWIADAMIRNRTPGTIYRLSHDDVLGLPAHQASAHHIGLAEGLRWILLTFPRMAGLEFRLWGIEPARLGPGDGLTGPVAAALRTVSAEMLEALAASREISCD